MWQSMDCFCSWRFTETPTTFGFRYDMEVELSHILRDGNNVGTDASLQIKG